jgi:hypothetical protein
VQGLGAAVQGIESVRAGAFAVRSLQEHAQELGDHRAAAT